MNGTHATSTVIKDFGQWVVTPLGLECTTRQYTISKRRLRWSSLADYMRDRCWIDMESFTRALEFARDHLIAPQGTR